jgi:hypothetical protein
MAAGRASSSAREIFVAARGRRRDLVELAIAYGLILLVVWTPRPWQSLLWWDAAAAVAIIVLISFDGVEAMGLRSANLLRSLWVVGMALAAAAAAVLAAARLHTLHLPASPVSILERFWAYALWAFAQQFLLQCFFLKRLLRLLPSAKSAALAAAVLFAIAHLPNPILTSVTLFWGFAACLIFLRYRNLYPLAVTHAIFGIAIAITVPGAVDHNMRVGLGYLTYGHEHRPAALPEP